MNITITLPEWAAWAIMAALFVSAALEAVKLWLTVAIRRQQKRK